MAFELKEGQGTFFRNDKKAEGSKQPDYRGELMLNGALHEVAGWIKEGNRGKWMSLSVKQKTEGMRGGLRTEPPVNEDADPIPF